jgi:hypothetical protein
MKGLEKFECRVPRGANVVAHEPGYPDVFGEAIGIKWSNVSGWWVEVRSEDEGVRTYPADQVEVKN